MTLISAGHKLIRVSFMALSSRHTYIRSYSIYLPTILRYLARYSPELRSVSRHTSGTFAIVLMIVCGGPVSRSFIGTHGCSLDMVPFVQSHHLAEAF